MMRFLFLLTTIPLFAEPLTITSNQMTYNDKTKISTATGDVIATINRPDGENILKADTLIIHHADQNQNLENLQKIEADGNVVFTNSQAELKADKCSYDPTKELVSCTGHVHVLDFKKQDTVSGDEGVMNLKDKIYTVQSHSPNKAEANISTKKQKKILDNPLPSSQIP